VWKFARLNALCRVNQSLNGLFFISTQILALIAALVWQNALTKLFFPETDVPQAFVAGGGEYLSMPMPTKEGVTPKRESLPGFKLTTLEDEGITIYGRVLDEGEVVNLNDSSVSQGTKANAAYFKTGSGYNALNM
jgi:hypothetical protein